MSDNRAGTKLAEKLLLARAALLTLPPRTGQIMEALGYLHSAKVLAAALDADRKAATGFDLHFEEQVDDTVRRIETGNIDLAVITLGGLAGTAERLP